MARWAERQQAFASALLDSNLPAPQGLVGPDGVQSERRFTVYRNNVFVLADGRTFQHNAGQWTETE